MLFQSLYLNVFIVIRKLSICSLFHFLFVLCSQSRIHMYLRRCKGWHSNKVEVRIANQLPCEVKERLLKVVVTLGRNIVVLEVLLAVEGDGLGLDFSLLDVDLVAAKDDGDVLANADEVTCSKSRLVAAPCTRANMGSGTYGASWGRSCT